MVKVKKTQPRTRRWKEWTLKDKLGGMGESPPEWTVSVKKRRPFLKREENQKNHGPDQEKGGLSCPGKGAQQRCVLRKDRVRGWSEEMTSKTLVHSVITGSGERRKARDKASHSSLAKSRVDLAKGKELLQEQREINGGRQSKAGQHDRP